MRKLAFKVLIFFAFSSLFLFIFGLVFPKPTYGYRKPCNGCGSCIINTQFGWCEKIRCGCFSGECSSPQCNWDDIVKCSCGPVCEPRCPDGYVPGEGAGQRHVSCGPCSNATNCVPVFQPQCDSSCGICGYRTAPGSDGCTTNNACCHRECHGCDCVTVSNPWHEPEDDNRCGPPDCCVPPTNTPTPTPTPLRCPENQSVTCGPGEGKATFVWDLIRGAQDYVLRINREPFDDWANVNAGDQWVGVGGNTCATNGCSIVREIENNRNYQWNIQGVKPGEVYPYSGEICNGSPFICSVATPTPTPTPSPTSTPTPTSPPPPPPPTSTPTSPPGAPTPTPTSPPSLPTSTPTSPPSAPTATPTTPPGVPTATPTSPPGAPTPTPTLPASCDCDYMDVFGTLAKGEVLNFETYAKVPDPDHNNAKVLNMVYHVEKNGTEIAQSAEIPAIGPTRTTDPKTGKPIDRYHTKWSWKVPSDTTGEVEYYIWAKINCARKTFTFTTPPPKGNFFTSLLRFLGGFFGIKETTLAPTIPPTPTPVVFAPTGARSLQLGTFIPRTTTFFEKGCRHVRFRVW